MNKNFLEEILKSLKKKGCHESDILYSENKTISSSSRLGKIEKTETSEIKEIGIRTIKNKKQSIISTTNLEPKNIDDLVNRVVEMVKVIPKNEFCGLANKNQIKNFKFSEISKLEICDSYEPTLDEINDKVLELENAALKNKKIINSEGAEIAFSKTKIILVGSNGFENQVNKTHSDFIIAVLAGNSKSMERAYDYKSKVFFEDLGDMKKIGEKVSNEAIKKLNAKKIKTCKCDVIFDSKVSSSLLSNLFNASNAVSIIKGTSFLKNKKNKQIFSKSINIIDDPLMKRKLRSRLVDSEGIQTRKKHLIKDGSLEFFYNSLSSARQLKEEPSGHASRSASSIPNASYSNLYLENGKSSKEDMVKSLRKGLLVTELMGSSINYSNGDYSRGASGFWIENGKISFPVSEITIAGNLKNIFSKLIPADDLEFNYGINAPSLLVENLTLGGI